MKPTELNLLELTDLHDELLLPWLDLYEISFAPEEKEPVSSHIRLLKKKMRGETTDTSMLVAVDKDQKFVGLIKYEVLDSSPVAVLWYFATSPEIRGKGYGSAIYRLFIKRLQDDGISTLVYEVEIPEEATNPEDREFARRRIEFYRRLGAQVLGGIHYMQSVEFYDPIPMHIMIHGIESIDSDAAYEIAKSVFGDSLTQVATPTLS